MEKETFPDATVVAASKSYIWVEINKDRTPALAKQFNVVAFPSYIVVNKELEKIHRFQAFMKPDEFVAQLQEGLTRYDLYKSGKEWDTPNPRPDTLCADAIIRT